ncbi:MAG TPA: hypothetical protein PLZ86_05865 [bacterium]|nr:hypothetical protein [bacterium]
MNETLPTADMKPPSARLIWGGGFFILAWILPLFIPLVIASDLSAEVKTALSGFMLIGLPEVATLIAVAILGKPGFNWLKVRIFALIKRAAPSAKVGRTRYYAGIAIFVALLVLTTVEPYVADFVPGLETHRRFYTGAADIVFVVTLFILGGDFWDKLRSLFSYDAKAHFPK